MGELEFLVKYAPGWLVGIYLAYRLFDRAFWYFKSRNGNGKVNGNGSISSVVKEIAQTVDLSMEQQKTLAECMNNHDRDSRDRVDAQTRLLATKMEAQINLLTELSGSLKTLVTLYRQK